MGHRGNYILRENGKTKIFYTHWRTYKIAHDLLVDPKEYIEYIKRFELRDQLVFYPWIEGFVIVDLDNMKLVFSEIEFLYQYSVRQEFLKILAKIWEGWNIEYAEKGLYKLAEKVDQSYISNHEEEFNLIKFEEFQNGEDEEFFRLITFFKSTNGEKKVNYYDLELDSVLLLGERIIAELEASKSKNLIQEIDFFDAEYILYINLERKEILINEGIPLLKEKLETIWVNWKISIRDIGYIGFVKEIGLNSNEIEMTQEEVKNSISEIKRSNEDFNLDKFGEKLKKTQTNIKFHSNFFENIKPKEKKSQNWIKRIIQKFKE